MYNSLVKVPSGKLGAQSAENLIQIYKHTKKTRGIFN